MGIILEKDLQKTANIQTPWIGDFDPKSVDENARTIKMIFTSSNKDLDGDIVETKGLDFSLFSGTVLWSHNMDIPSVVKILPQTIRVYAKRAEAVAQFDGLTQFGVELFDLAKQGFIKAWSFTFRALEYDAIKEKDDVGNDITTGFHVHKAQVLEISLVNIGANPKALSKSFTKSFENPNDEESQKYFTELVNKAYSHNSTIKDGEPSWGDVDKTKLPREAFADMGEEDKKSTWKYPHHWISAGKMYLHEGGLNAAWAAAQGARSGQEASASVKSHLRKHRNALGKKDITNLLIYEDGKLSVKSGGKHLDIFALDKSFQERGKAGKIPVEFNLIEGIKQPKILIELESVKENDETITEAKVASIVLDIPIPNGDPTPENGSQEKSKDIKPFSKHLIEAEKERVKLLLLISEEL